MTNITKKESGPSSTSRLIKMKALHILDKILTYLWVNATAVVAILFYRVLNRTEVIGRENLPKSKNLLLCSNHQTMIDSFLIGSIAFFPDVLLRPGLMPYHPAALENFFKGKVMTWMSKKWRCIPVRRGERDMLALSQMIKALKNATMILFPEGTRSRTGQVGPGRVGVGKLIYDTQAALVPVAIYGMDRVLPIGCVVPRIFKKIRIIFGEPMDLSDYYQMKQGKDTSRLIVDKVVSEITDLHNHLKTRDYLEKARKISEPLLRQRELSQMASLSNPLSKSEPLLNDQAHITEPFVNDEQVH